MRVFTRLFAVGILILSCGDGGVGPVDPCADSGELFLSPPSLRLVVGSADQTFVSACEGGPAPAGLSWVSRNSSVAAVASEDPGGFASPDAVIIEAIAPGETFVAVTGDGYLDSLQVTVPDTVVLGPISQIAAGGDVSCALEEGGDALCWGGSYYALGDPEGPSVGTCWGFFCSPVPVLRNTNAQSVYAADSHACTLNASSRAWCWGDNGASLLGVDPVQVSILEFVSLALGTRHTCGLTPAGSVYCWGDNSLGRLGGNQRDGPVSTPEPVAGGLTFVSLDAQSATSCGATNEGHLYCWGNFGVPESPLPGTEACQDTVGKGTITVRCAYGPLRMFLDTSQSTDSLFTQVGGSCALASGGTVFCWDPSLAVYSPVLGFGPFDQIARGGGLHNCALTAGAASCWGSNEYSQLGDGTINDREDPVAVSGGHTFSQLVLGAAHTCGLTVAKEVWCWGLNRVGQASGSILDNPGIPVKVRGQG